MGIGYDVSMTNNKSWKYQSINNEDIESISDYLNISKLAAKILNAANFNKDNMEIIFA